MAEHPATDPCPSAQQVGSSDGWQHAFAVRCSVCERPLRFAWWIAGAHYCGRCRYGRGDADA